MFRISLLFVSSRSLKIKRFLPNRPSPSRSRKRQLSTYAARLTGLGSQASTVLSIFHNDISIVSLSHFDLSIASNYEDPILVSLHLCPVDANGRPI
jgi:hypothetical protein